MRPALARTFCARLATDSDPMPISRVCSPWTTMAARTAVNTSSSPPMVTSKSRTSAVLTAARSRMRLTDSTISSVARCVCCDSDLTSPATTRKPAPASPARAASMVAFSASRLVCVAMALIILTTRSISLIEEVRSATLDSAERERAWALSTAPTAVVNRSSITSLWLCRLHTEATNWSARVRITSAEASNSPENAAISSTSAMASCRMVPRARLLSVAAPMPVNRSVSAARRVSPVSPRREAAGARAGGARGATAACAAATLETFRQLSMLLHRVIGNDQAKQAAVKRG